MSKRRVIRSAIQRVSNAPVDEGMIHWRPVTHGDKSGRVNLHAPAAATNIYPTCLYTPRPTSLLVFEWKCSLDCFYCR
jgi:hypothetical protein